MIVVAIALLAILGVALVAMAILAGAVLLTGARLLSDDEDLPWNKTARLLWFLVTASVATAYAVMLSEGTAEEDGWSQLPESTLIIALLVVATAPAIAAIYLDPRKLTLPASALLATVVVLGLVEEWVALVAVTVVVYLALAVYSMQIFFAVEAARKLAADDASRPARGPVYWLGGAIVVVVIVGLFPFGELLLWLLFPKARVRKPKKAPADTPHAQLPASPA